MRIFLLLLILLFANSYLIAAEPKLPNNQWQTSFGGSKQILSVRHKMIGVNRNYNAQFIVLNTNTKETYYSDILVKGAEWGEVIFPDDFRKKDGSMIYNVENDEKYIWNCIVDGDIVVDGTFSFSSSLFKGIKILKFN